MKKITLIITLSLVFFFLSGMVTPKSTSRHHRTSSIHNVTIESLEDLQKRYGSLTLNEMQEKYDIDTIRNTIRNTIQVPIEEFKVNHVDIENPGSQTAPAESTQRASSPTSEEREVRRECSRLKLSLLMGANTIISSGVTALLMYLNSSSK